MKKPKFNFRQLKSEYNRIISRISCLYRHPVTLEKGAKNGQNRFWCLFRGDGATKKTDYLGISLVLPLKFKKRWLKLNLCVFPTKQSFI